jgi:dihydroflavonol-4-reductase
MADVLVTGGSGFIGINLLRRLAAAGAHDGRRPRVRALLRNPDAATALDGLAIERVRGDILDYASVRAAMDGVEHVYHVAGRVDLSPFHRAGVFAVNVEGTDNVCRAALDAGVRRLVHTSTISTIGTGAPDAPADETSVFSVPGLSVPYFESKRAGELRALEHGAKSRMDVVVVNPSFVLGAYDVGPSSGEVILLATRLGGVPLYARGALNAVAVDDVVTGHINAMAKGRPGERYILGNENLSHRALLTLIADELGLRPPRLPIWEPGARLFTIWGDLLGPYFPNAFRNWNTAMLKVAGVAQYVSCEKARRELDLPQTPVRQAIREAYDWYAANGRLRCSALRR